MKYTEEQLKSRGIYGVTALACLDSVTDGDLPLPGENEYLFLYCAEGMQGFFLNRSLLELHAGEILYLNRFSGPVAVRRQKERARLYLIGLRNEPRAFGLTDETRVGVFTNIYKYFVQRTYATPTLRYDFERVFGTGERHYDLFFDGVLDGGIKLLVNELNTCCNYHSICGADWSVCHPAFFSVAVENPAEIPAAFAVRIDSEGDCCDSYYDGVLISQTGDRLPQTGQYFAVVPPHFVGRYDVPLNPALSVSRRYYHLERTSNFTRIMRVVYSIGKLGDSGMECPSVGTELRLGAQTLRDGNGGILRSLSYFTDWREEKTLTEEQFALLFNKQYYHGLEVTYDGMIHCRQTRVADELPLVCTVMGAERKSATCFPADVAAALDYIHRGFRGQIHIEDLARQAFLSPSHFQEKFRSCTGFSPLKYVDWLRIREAKRLIREDETVSLTELAYRLGFSSPSHFSYAFRRLTGVTPSEYRKTGIV